MSRTGDRRHPYHSRLVNAVIWYLREKMGWTVWANDVGRFTGKGVYGKAGTPDIIGYEKIEAIFIRARGQLVALAHGVPVARFIGVECKVGKDVLRPKQERFLKKLRSSGGLAMVVRLPKSSLGSDSEAKKAVKELLKCALENDPPFYTAKGKAMWKTGDGE